eukprot:765875-Hanusia_phi.AAC.5
MNEADDGRGEGREQEVDEGREAVAKMMEEDQSNETAKGLEVMKQEMHAAARTRGRGAGGAGEEWEEEDGETCSASL